jgi:hypothetical protein
VYGFRLLEWRTLSLPHADHFPLDADAVVVAVPEPDALQVRVVLADRALPVVDGPFVVLGTW